MGYATQSDVEALSRVVLALVTLETSRWPEGSRVREVLERIQGEMEGSAMPHRLILAANALRSVGYTLSEAVPALRLRRETG